MVDSQGSQPLAASVEEKEAQGYQLVWEAEKKKDNLSIGLLRPLLQALLLRVVFKKQTIRYEYPSMMTQPKIWKFLFLKECHFEKAYGSIPNAPTKKGHTFVRSVNSFDNSTLDFTSPVQAPTTVYALFFLSASLIR